MTAVSFTQAKSFLALITDEPKKMAHKTEVEEGAMDNTEVVWQKSGERIHLD